MNTEQAAALAIALVIAAALVGIYTDNQRTSQTPTRARVGIS